MARITNTIDIDAPSQQVYETLRALDAYPTWLRHSTVYRGTTTGVTPTATGLTYVDSTMVGRMRGELIEDERLHVLRFHQSRPKGQLDALIRYDVDDTGTGTRVTRVGELTTRGMLRAVQPILLRMASAESDRTMKALKVHAEKRG